MAKHGQHPQEPSASEMGGGGQTVVEMSEVTETSLIFWSRHRFQIGAELQIRMHREALPSSSQAGASAGEWVMMRGFVVQSSPLRREDGRLTFRVVLVFDTALARPTKLKSKPCFRSPAIPGIRAFGLN
jgi:hypothetical protein